MSSSQSPWELKIRNADKYYKDWSRLFKCQTLEDYYEGRQWKGRGLETSSYRPYMLNMVFSTIDTKLSNLLIQNPEFILTPAPGFADWNIDFASKSANLKQDVLNTKINEKNAAFVENTKLAALDSFFRFGIIQTGYSADWKNPAKKPALLKSHYDLEVNPAQDSVIEDVELPENERVFFKHVKASRFRVSTSDSPILSNCSWCGYYAYYYKSSLLKTKGVNLPKEAKSSLYSSDYDGFYPGMALKEEDEDALFLKYRDGAIIKVWHIWDNETNETLDFWDGYFNEPLSSDVYERLPFNDVRWNLRAPSLGSWYPIPPVYQWLSPQDEINLSREQMRNYRNRYTRKWTVTGTMDTEEEEKLQSNIDGQVVHIKREGQLQALQNPEVTGTITGDLVASKDDFNAVAGVAEARASDRATATATNVNAEREKVREGAEKIQFDSFICDTAREALLVIQERFSEGFWVKRSLDAGDDFLGEVQNLQPIWDYVTSQDVDDGYDFSIKLNVIAESPQAMKEELGKFVSFLSIVTQFPAIAFDPVLIREAAYKSGYRNEKVISRMQQMAMIQAMGLAASGGEAGSAGNSANNISKNTLNNATPNSVGEIEAQLQGQMG